jgi:predicted Zn-dependent protease
VFCLVFASCSTVPITGRRQLSIVPVSQVVSMSADSYSDLIKSSKLSTNARDTAMVRSVGQKIAASAELFLRENGLQADLVNYKWEFNLIDDSSTVNAFCMPGGKVAVYTGILLYTKDQSGLAVVIGHEVAHAIANHGGERMSQMMIAEFGSMALAQAIKDKPAKTQQIFITAFGIGADIGVILPYSRSHELEADRIGLILMARAGYDPLAAVPFWERMNQQKGGRPPEFLSTHPAEESRIAGIQAAIPEAMKYYNDSGK